MPSSIIEYILTTVAGLVVAIVAWLIRKVLMIDRETALIIQLAEEREKRRVETEKLRDKQRDELIKAIGELRAAIIQMNQ